MSPSESTRSSFGMPCTTSSLTEMQIDAGKPTISAGPDVAPARWNARAAEVEAVMLAESARWGDNRRAEPYTIDDWRARRDGGRVLAGDARVPVGVAAAELVLAGGQRGVRHAAARARRVLAAEVVAGVRALHRLVADRRQLARDRRHRRESWIPDGCAADRAERRPPDTSGGLHRGIDCHAALLDATAPSVTPEGFGYDPARGELWFAGETAEAVLLELQGRRRGERLEPPQGQGLQVHGPLGLPLDAGSPGPCTAGRHRPGPGPDDDVARPRAGPVRRRMR